MKNRDTRDKHSGYPVVFNAEIGGYSIPDRVVERYAEKKGIPLSKEIDSPGLPLYFTEDGEMFIPEYIPRHDALLIEAIKELIPASRSGARHGDFAIQNIQDDRYVVVTNSDGTEQVVTPSSMEKQWVVIEDT